MGKRPATPRKIEKSLFQEVDSRCPLCRTDDVSVLRTHHIIPYPEKQIHDQEHMIVLCANCHAKADRGEISREDLYAAKKGLHNTKLLSGRKDTVEKVTVTGDANVTAGRDVNISGDVHIKISKQKGKSSRAMVIPGTVSEDPRKVGYLKYLVKRYNELKEWQVGKSNMKYPMIYKAYQREIKYSIGNTPLELFEAAGEFLQKRIANTMVGRIRASEGKALYKSFDDFDKQ